MSIQMLEAALEYAAKGWHVFPCRPNQKIPVTQNGHLAATTDAETITKFWTKHPDCNIGLFLAKSGLVCVDADTYKDDCEFNQYVQGQDMPDTLVQKSARGGTHLIYQADEQEKFPGSLCRSTEIKHQGYILVAPSKFDGGEYEWQTDDDPAPAPHWMPRQPTLQVQTQIDLGRQPLDVQKTIQDIKSGDEWHNNILRLVGKLVAGGMTDEDIHAITDSLTLPGYTLDQTQRQVKEMIEKARQKGFGPAQELTKEEIKKLPSLDFKSWQEKDLAAIPSPDFIYTDWYARGYTSLTVAPPKVGKSMLALAEAVDMASGKGILSGIERKPLKVLYFNAEDDQDVLDARIAALITCYNLSQEDIIGRLFPVSGIEMDDFCLIAGQEGVINEKLFQQIERFIADNKIDVLVFDPLQDLSRSPETNEIFRPMGQRLRLLATQTNVALGLIHHTRKIAPGVAASIDDARGGGALRGTARFNRILVSMSEDEGVRAGINNHKYYFRIGDAESNLAPPSAEINQWYEKVSVITPSGQSVGAVRRWNWPDAFTGVTTEDAANVRAAVDAMREHPPRESIRANNWVGHVVASVLGMNADDQASRARIKEMIRHWVGTDVLAVEDYQDSRAGRTTKVVVAGSNNPNFVEAQI